MAGEPLGFEPLRTPFGVITVSITPVEHKTGSGINELDEMQFKSASILSDFANRNGAYQLPWQSQRFAKSPALLLQLSGFESVAIAAGSEVSSAICVRIAK